jgi:hypothetical protein
MIAKFSVFLLPRPNVFLAVSDTVAKLQICGALALPAPALKRADAQTEPIGKSRLLQVDV